MTATATAEKIVIYVFTDPMMGLSYESEPVLEKLQETFGEKLAFRYVMAGLVRDVHDFMTPAERAMEPALGIQMYNRRLAGIYLQEEPLGGLPMDMSHFHLFDENHRSSYPLDLVFEAVRLLDAERAELFLYALRRATILEGKQTTKIEELVKIAQRCGLNKEKFLDYFQNGRAAAAFEKDLQFTQSLGIHSLPAYLIQYQGQVLLVNGMPGYQQFCQIIQQIK